MHIETMIFLSYNIIQFNRIVWNFCVPLLKNMCRDIYLAALNIVLS